MSIYTLAERMLVQMHGRGKVEVPYLAMSLKASRDVIYVTARTMDRDGLIVRANHGNYTAYSLTALGQVRAETMHTLPRSHSAKKEVSA